MKTLRPDQERAMSLLRQAVAAGKRRVLICAPTGFGKTILASKIIRGGLAKGSRSCFTAPAIRLVDQTLEKFWAEGLTDVGVIQADHFLTDWSQPVQIASVQTLASRKKFPEANIVLVDEVHNQFDIIYKWMDDPDHYNTLFIGFSATPGAKGLGFHWEELLVPVTIGELIREGVLCDFQVYGPKIKPDLKGVKIAHGDYQEAALSAKMQESALVADAVETWLQRANFWPTFNFGVDRAHAKTLQAAYMASGIPWGYMDSYTPKPERAQILSDWRAGLLKGISNCEILTTGVDEDVHCLQVCRPTKSRDLHVQIIGRLLRNPSGIKPNLPNAKVGLILDHTMNHLTHGFVTDIIYSHLDKTQKGEKQPTEAVPKEKLPKECPKCHFLVPRGIRSCPQCGFTPTTINRHDHLEGELIQLSKKKKGPLDLIPDSEFYAQLKFIERESGKKETWAAAMFKDRKGYWPNDFSKKSEMKPTPDVINWITHKNIAWTKSKKNKRNSHVN